MDINEMAKIGFIGICLAPAIGSLLGYWIFVK